jgi:hypothetical protein
MAAMARHPLVPAAIAAWLGYIGLDFLIHAALLAAWWRATGAYWLPQRELFVRIPYAYASFAIYCVALTWLLERISGTDVRVSSGWRLGAIAGLVYGTTSALAMYSVVGMPASALLVWPGSAVVESTTSGGVAAWVLRARRPWRRVGVVAIGVVISVLVAIVLQNLLPREDGGRGGEGQSEVVVRSTPNSGVQRSARVGFHRDSKATSRAR